MDNIKIHMYNIGSFRIIWDEESFTLKGEPTVVERYAYSGNLKSTATMLHKKSEGMVDITSFVDRTIERLPGITRPVESDISRVEPYTNKTWQGSLLATLKGENYWKATAWTHREGIRNWFYYSFFQDTPVSIDALEDELLGAVTKFERIVL